MALALDELVVRSRGPDRLPDAAQAGAVATLPLDELLPGRHDARRVGAHLGHVGEHHELVVLAELTAEQRDLLRGLDDEHGVAVLEALPDKRKRPEQKVRLARIEEGLVTERLDVHVSTSHVQNSSPGSSAHPMTFITFSICTGIPCSTSRRSPSRG